MTSARTSLPRLGSWVRIPSPAPKNHCDNKETCWCDNVHSASIGRTKREDTLPIREKSGKSVRPVFSPAAAFSSADSRPERGRGAPRAARVKAGRRPPPEAARSGLDGGEH